ncbi:Cadherin domain-containing protein [Neorhodopirellula lusitana]|uniref:Cadherin domain-containing protein n=1 Tax=Neorhodopirellula lusitana TaxID=445327 RepID=A0ABY1QP19_9BACT|nr:cadherin domain-containing protein [Neorhodopirellula lusitana]SMP76114.1 Cadherin domain-containing protein [Neorhodopirellula lusitana]
MRKDWYQRLRMVADELMTNIRQEAARDHNLVKHRASTTGLQLTGLEPRLLFSATPVDPALAESAGNADTSTVMVVDQDATSSSASDNQDAFESEQGESAFGELVVVDSSISNLEAVLDDLSQNRPDAEVLVLDSGRDGVDQISELLDQRSGITSIHIVSHAEDGEIRLGQTKLGIDNLDAYAGQIANWQSAFTTDADILFYGCELGSDPGGIEFLESIATLTDADVAASDDDTGHSKWGGDWDLEYELGEIETEVAFSSEFQDSWQGKLASVTITVTSTEDNINSSDGLTTLREAIIQANENTAMGTGDEITIELAAETYTITLSGAGEDTGYAGDFDIHGDVKFVGVGSSAAIIDADGKDRVFEVHSGTVEFTNMTFTNGSTSANGGGILVAVSSNVTISQSTITNNDGLHGAGIFNDGTLTLTDVTISNNSLLQTGEGGGLYHNGTTTLNRVTIFGNKAEDGAGIFGDTSATGLLSLLNTTISGNTADDEGGGLCLGSDAMISYSTITLNEGKKGGGLHVNGGGGTVVNLQASIIAENIDNNGAAKHDIEGDIVSLGENLIGDTEGGDGFHASDILDQESGLLGLADNGGFVMTHALPTSSPAIDAVTPGSTTTDARGIARNGANYDMGAYQSTTITNGDETLVNQTTNSTQETSGEDRGSQSAVSVAGDGSYVVVWTADNQFNDGNDKDIYARRFAANGVALTDEILVNTTVDNDQEWARVASASDGSFVVTWTSEDDVYYRRFDADGTALMATDQIATVTTENDQKNSDISMNAVTGEFVIIWQGNGEEPGQSDSSGILGQRFHADGTTNGGEFLINTDTASTKYDASVSMNPEGEFVVAWDDSSGVHVQRFDSSGAKVGGEIDVDGSNSAGNADIAMHSDGSFVTTWRDTGEEDIFFRRYDDSGSALDSAQQINAEVLFLNSFDSSISMDSDGNFIIVWELNGFGAESIYYRKYDNTGSAIASSSLVNQTNGGARSGASVSVIDMDNFVVVWSGEGDQSGQVDSSGVFVRQYGTLTVDSAPSLTTTVSNPTFAENSGAVSLFGGTVADTNDSGQTFTELQWTVTNVSEGSNEIVTADGSSFALVDGTTGTTTTNSMTYLVSVTGTTATVTLSNGSLTATEMESLVDSITYQNTSEAPTDANRAFKIISVKDSGANGSGGSNTMAPNITSTVNVNPVNDAPTLSGGPTTLATTNDDTPATGQQVSTILGNLTAADAEGETLGIVVVATTGDGDWQFSTNSTNGIDGTWTSVGSITTDASPLLSNTTWVRYDPNSNGAESPTLTLAAWDGSTGTASTSGSVSTADLTGGKGGSTAFSASNAVLGLTVDQANAHTPEITTGQTFNVNENSIDGVVVGDVQATDADTSYTLSDWTIVSGNDGGHFEIDANGQITTTGSPLLDRESTASYTLGITVSDGTNVSTAGTVTINVTDTNDNKPVITPGQTLNIDENVAEGTATDEAIATTDVDQSTTLSGWTIVGGTGAGLFDINATTGVVTTGTGTTLDRENAASYTLQVTVSDGVQTSDIQTITIAVGDLNDNKPVITPGQTLNIDENVAEGTATDEAIATTDADQSTTLSSWTIVGGTGAGLFDINATTGVVTTGTGTSLDRENAASYTLQATVSDGVQTSDIQTITIAVGDINDNKPVITPGQTLNIDENVAEGTATDETIATTDVDESTTLSSWTIVGGTGAGLFDINATTGVVTTGTGTSLDRENAASYTLQVTVSDGVQTSDIQTITIAVGDINDNAPVITGSQTLNITENSAAGSSVGTILANDADTTGTIQSWTIVGGSGSSLFDVNASTGAVTVATGATLDHEDTSSYTLTVTAGDGVNTSSTQTVTINIDDANDNKPVITPGQTLNIDENVAEGTATDETIATTDVDQSTTLSSWTIVGGTGAGLFDINATTGVVTTGTGTTLDRENAASYTLQVTVSDGVQTSDIQTITIAVGDINDNAPVITGSQTLNITENSAAGSSVGTILANDADTTGSIQSWTIVGGTGSSLFDINASTGAVTVATGATLDHEDTSSYTLTVTAGDGVNTSSTQTVTINIDDANDAATGVPVIQGALDVASTLTADTSGVVDQDGIASISYQWLRDGVDIAGATNSTYELVLSDEGSQFQVRIQVTDNDSEVQTLDSATTATVVNSNTAPILDNHQYSMTAGTNVSGSVAGFVALINDPDGGPYTAALVSAPLVGTLDLQADGSYTYTAQAGFVGQVSFQWKASDGIEISDTATVTINVIPPVITLPTGGDDSGLSTTSSAEEGDSRSETETVSEDDSSKDETKDETEGDAESSTSEATTDAGIGIAPPNTNRATTTETTTNSTATNLDSTGSSQAGSGVVLVDIAGVSASSSATSDSGSNVETRNGARSSGVGFNSEWTRMTDAERSLMIADYALMSRPGQMWDSLDEYNKNVEMQIQGDLILVGSAGAAASSFTVGVLAWAMRSGFLLSGLIAHMPAWSGVDPLMILQGGNAAAGGNQETLEELMDRQSKAIDSEGIAQ